METLKTLAWMAGGFIFVKLFGLLGIIVVLLVIWYFYSKDKNK